jgi:hypothetical protein
MRANKHACVALLGWFPPVYLLGIIRYWGKGWATDGGWVMDSPLPVFWWPTRLYRARKRGYFV